jgi:Protein of unknown function (DUF3659)
MSSQTGRAPKLPSTPTKAGKNPSSNTTPKLGQAKDTAQSATNTPQSAAKGAADQAKQTAGKATNSPKLPPRPKGADDAASKAKDLTSQGTEQAKDKAEEATGKAQDTAKGAKGKAEESTGNAQDTAKGATEQARGQINLKDNDQGEEDDGPGGKVTQATEDTEGDLESADPEPLSDSVDDSAAGTKETAADTTDNASDVEDNADDEGTEGGEEEASGGLTGGLQKGAQGAAGKASGLKDTATSKASGAKGTATKATGKAGKGDVTGAAQDTAQDAQEGAQDTANGVKDTAEDAAEGVQDQLPDLSILKGLSVSEGGKILDQSGNPVGEVTEGDPEDLVDQEVGDDGEILDEDGDVIGRVKTLPQQAQETAGAATDKAQDAAGDAKDQAEDAAETYLPDLSILKGLEVTESGEIFDQSGNVVGKISEGDPETLAGQILNEEGEVLDEDGDAIGRAEVVPQPIKDAAEDAADQAQEGLPDLSTLKGQQIGEDGQILDESGNAIGKVTEGDPSDLAGKSINEKGEILDDENNVIGKATTTADEAKQNLPDISALEGLEVQKDGNIIGPDGNVLGRITEGDPADLAGKTLNAEGEVVDEDGDAIGRAEVVAQEAQEKADGLKPDLSIIKGMKINKKGKILDEDGEVLAQLTEDSDEKKCIGKIPNEKGEILDDKGKVVGHVEIVPGEAADEAMKALHPELVQEAAKDAEGVDLSSLEGYKVNKKGDVLNEDGETIGRVSEGELSDVAGKKINDKGEILDKDGNVVGKVELVPQADEEGEGEGEGEGESELPPLSTLEGMKCNKTGYIVDSEGNPMGRLVEGDAKKISKMGLECDNQGQFWDNKGHVVGRAETVPRQDDGEDAPFSGLEGLLVVKDGWVEDENGNRVGYLTEGDTKKLVGRAVDEDGDVIDKRGNVVGHAERYEEEEAAEPEKPDLSVLSGLTCNKQGNVIGHEGVPIARLVEGNPKELAGRKIDGEGQIWNDSGKVVGRCELIPEDEREAKPEGPFAGLEGLVVIKGGWVEDEDGNRVGQVVDGDAKKLVGRAVDEDGDIIDKYGNVKGHAEPYEEPEEEATDLSILAGKTVNKAGNVVDEHGTVFGRIAGGDPKKLAGCKVDGEGQIWNDAGKVIGQAELIPGDQQQKGQEGPFAGFESLTIGKDGYVVDDAGDIVGRIVEGDPKKLKGRKVDEDGEVLDRNGNSIGRAERWEPEEKEREVNPMSGHKVNKEGEVRDENGELIGRLTDGNLGTCVGKAVDDNGYVVDNDGNKIGECTLLENIQEEEEETEEQRTQRENAEIAKKMIYILRETLDKMNPICQQITDVSRSLPLMKTC